MTGIGRVGPVFLILGLSACACSGGPGDGDAGVPDGAMRDSAVRDSGDPDSGVCRTDEECDDGLFCDGLERCLPGRADADSRGCVTAPDPVCDAEELCDETLDRCTTECDADGDGHDAVRCGGDDCDDGDPNRFPGNTEVCDAAHDEDCNGFTLGATDLDADGYVDAACCNVGMDTVTRCGDDCDDARIRANPAGVEVCDGLDDDCDGSVDEGALSTFFRDADGDMYGVDGDTVEACSAGALYRATVGGDCDDGDSAVNPAATERCNGANDDCDSMTDEAPASAACALPAATAACASGTCTLVSCDSGFGNCDGVSSNGCETNLATDAMHCGGCGSACSLANATRAICVSSTCRVDACNPAFGDCDSVDANGCEESLRTLSDCGACDAVCTRANATAMCSSAGMCGIASCNSGYGNCDALDSNGCEQRLNTTTHCGGCGVGCALAHADSTCGTGSCAISSCQSGWCNPPGSGSADGCERQIDTNPVCVGGTSLPLLIDVDGDSSDTTGLTATGSGEMWFRAIIRETNLDSAGEPACENIGARFRIASSGDAAYTMNIYCSSCTGTRTYVGLSPVVIARRDPPNCAIFGGDTADHLTLYIQVEHAYNVRTGCGSWTVTAEPDILDGTYICG